MQQLTRHPLDHTDDAVDHVVDDVVDDGVDHGAEWTLTERLLVGLIIGMLTVGAVLAVIGLDADAAGTGRGVAAEFLHDLATDHDLDATGAATPEGNSPC